MLVLLAIAAAPAAAQSPPPNIPPSLWENREQVARWVVQNQPSVAPPGMPDPNNVATELYLEEHRPLPGQQSSAALRRELRRQAWKLRVRTGATYGIKALGRFTAVGTAATTGWWIGTEVGELFFGQEVSSPPAPVTSITHMRSWEPVEPNELIANGWVAPNGNWEIRAPDYGWYVIFDTNAAQSQTWLQWWEVPEGQNCSNPAPKPSDDLLTGAFHDGGTGASWIGDEANGNVACWPGGSFTFLPGEQTTVVLFQPHTPITAEPTPTDGYEAAHPAPIERNAQGSPLTQLPAPAPTWAEFVDEVINELSTKPQDYPLLTSWIEAQLDSGIEDPLVPHVDVPDCIGLAYADCADLLTELDLVPVETEVTWAEADLELPAGAVIETDPAEGARVETETEVDVRVNPDPLPVEVFEPLPFEHYTAYVDRLQDAGLVGQAEELPESGVDPLAGPEVVVRTTPQAGTRVAPGSTVIVRFNPPWVPIPGPGGGGCDAWVTPQLDFSPLQMPLPMVFPFALPWWLADVIGAWLGSPAVPSWDFVFPFGGEFTIDLQLFDPYMDEVRTITLVLATVAILWLFVGLAYGQVTGKGNESDRD